MDLLLKEIMHTFIPRRLSADPGSHSEPAAGRHYLSDDEFDALMNYHLSGRSVCRPVSFLAA
jgi:hypothetical protein